MMKVRETKDGLVIDVHVQPGAKRSRLVGVHGDAVKIAVAAPPVDGKANAALVGYLSELFGLRRSQIELVRGEMSREKVIRLNGMTAEEVRAKVAARLPSK